MAGQEQIKAKAKPKAKDQAVAEKGNVVSASKALEKIDEIIDKHVGKVEVMSGANYKEFDNLVGKKISAVRAHLSESFNIAPDALALVNGEQVAEDYIVKDTETIEFIKSSGVKGTKIAVSF